MLLAVPGAAGNGRRRRTEAIMRPFISSTSIDLKDYRQAVIYACQKLGVVPVNMEEFQPDSDPGPAVSLEKVRESNLYIGLFAYRYGFVPAGSVKSVTEQEYDEATRLGLERLIWIVDPDLLWPPKFVETGAGAAKLADFLVRLKAEHTVRFFTEPHKLTEDILLCLPQYLAPEEARSQLGTDRAFPMPVPPKPFVPFGYSLLQVSQVVGRLNELDQLTDWFLNRPEKSVMCVVAVGGQGKSALTWQWFGAIAPAPPAAIEGRIWWSFYESDCSFQRFVVRSLVYLTSQREEEVRDRPLEDQCQALLAVLNERRILVVLDGLERVLTAYMKLDAARIPDQNVATENVVSQAASKQYRRAADPQVDRFLRQLLAVSPSRILVSTRLFPSEFENSVDGAPLAACQRLDLKGLEDADALSLWHSFVKEAADEQELLRLFATFEKHPLLIQTLAGEVANFREAPGNFAAWRRWNPQFDPFRLPIAQRTSHILEHSLKGLGAHALRVLNTLSAFRMSVPYSALRALLAGGNENLQDLLMALIELEERNLVGWDRAANRYDLHPIVRGVVWTRMAGAERQDILRGLERYFSSARAVDPATVASIEDLIPLIEHFNASVGLERWNEAAEDFSILRETLGEKFGGGAQIAELGRCFFPKGPAAEEQNTAGFSREARSQVLLLLGRALQDLGDLQTALAYLIAHQKLCDSAVCYAHQASVHFQLGSLREGIRLYGLALEKVRQTPLYAADFEARLQTNLKWEFRHLGWSDCEAAARRRIGKLLRTGELEDDTKQRIRRLQLLDALAAKNWAACKRLIAWLEKKAVNELELQWVLNRARARMAEAQGALDEAKDFHSKALQIALAMANPFLASDSLRSLANIAVERGDLQHARDCLDRHSEILERTPIREEQAQGQLLLAKLEELEGRLPEAATAAKAASRFAWCDGPPFCLESVRQESEEFLRRLGAVPALPELPASADARWTANDVDPPAALHRSRRRSYRDLTDAGWRSPLELPDESLWSRLNKSRFIEDHMATIEQADRLLAAGSNDEHLEAIRATALWYTGQYELAQEAFTRLLERDPTNGSYRNSRGQIRAEMGLAVSALEDLADAGDAYGLSGMGLALGRLGRFREAFLAFDQSIELAPGNAWAYFNRAIVQELAGHPAEADADYRQALIVDEPSLPHFKAEIARTKLIDLRRPSIETLSERGPWSL